MGLTQSPANDAHEGQPMAARGRPGWPRTTRETRAAHQAQAAGWPAALISLSTFVKAISVGNLKTTPTPSPFIPQISYPFWAPAKWCFCVSPEASVVLSPILCLSPLSSPPPHAAATLHTLRTFPRPRSVHTHTPQGLCTCCPHLWKDLPSPLAAPSLL